MENAVVIKYIGDYEKSIEQEYAFLDNKYGKGGWDYGIVSLINKDEKVYDKMDLHIKATGKTMDFYFDITEPYAELSNMFKEK